MKNEAGLNPGPYSRPYSQAGQPSKHLSPTKRHPLIHAEICKGVPVVQLLRHASTRVSQFWQQSRLAAMAGFGFATTNAVKINAKRMNIRSIGRM